MINRQLGSSRFSVVALFGLAQTLSRLKTFILSLQPTIMLV